jgi:hypothetical protein
MREQRASLSRLRGDRRATALLLAVLLCWPMATPVFAGVSLARAQCTCCRRMSGKCHCCSHQNSGAAFQVICYCRGKIHAVATSPAHLAPVRSICFTRFEHASHIGESATYPCIATLRLHGSRAPPRTASGSEAI